ncbi:right-handed parallel beta-helix repeat-containing protein, partial [Bacteroidota bacterium]
GDYTTFNSAATALASGISGPVVFKVANGTYNEQLTIGQIAGVSSTNTITFQSASGDSTDVIIQYAAISSSNNWVVKLDNAEYITFKNLSIKAIGTSYAYVVHLTNGSENNVFESTIIESIQSTSSNARAVVLYSGALNQYNTFKNNLIKNGYYGIYCYGAGSSSLAQANIFEGNEIKDFYYYGTYFYYQDLLQFNGNIVDNRIGSGSVYGTRFLYCDNIHVIGNKINIHGTSTHYGMYIYYADATAANPGLIANNFISLTGTGTSSWYGMYVYYSTYINVYHNSINLIGGSTTSRCLYQYSGNNQNYKNNIFSNLGNGYAAYFNTPTAIISSDYNDYYTTSTNFVYWGSNKTNIAALQLASGKDANSLSVDPTFNSATDLHTSNAFINNAGTPIAGITNDIDGDTRHSTTPDIGADEYGQSSFTTMSGIYTIGQAGNPDYPSFNAAVSDLVSKGIHGPVIFNINAGTYVERVTIPAIIGASAANTISFQSASGDSTDVVLQFQSPNLNDNYTIFLNGADYIHIKSITIKALDASAAKVICFENGANYNVISNNVIQSFPMTSSLGHGFCIYMYGSYGGNDLNNNNEFLHNKIQYGHIGIRSTKTYSTQPFQTGNTFIGNQIIDFMSYAFFFDSEDGFVIKDNLIESDDSQASKSGIYGNHIGADFIIAKNRFIFNDALNGNAAIYFYNANATLSSNAVISNNFISINSSGNTFSRGIDFRSSTYIKVYHNSVNIYGTSSNSTPIMSDYCQNLISKNNSFANFSPNGRVLKRRASTAYYEADYNNYFKPSGFGFMIVNANQHCWSLADYQTLYGQEAHSISVDPNYISTTDLHTSSQALNNAGIYIGIMEDFDGESRNTISPDIGADEFTPITTCAQPTSQIEINITNTTADLNWTEIGTSSEWDIEFGTNGFNLGTGTLVNSITSKPYPLIGLASGSSYDWYVRARCGNNSSIWTGPKTFTTTSLCSPLSGNYSIGGTSPDFADFASAYATLQLCGISGPVVFNAANGTYPEHLTISQIVGVSANNTISFQSASGDSTDVIIQYAANSTSNNWVIKLDGAEYISFKNLTIKATGTSYAYGVHMTNGAEHNSIENCIVKSMSTSSSYGRPIVMYSGSVNQYNTIKNNVIQGGYYGLYIYGVNSSNFAKNNIIEGNDISGFRYYGMMLYYQESVQVIGNYIHDGIYSYEYGIYTYYTNNDFRIEKNKIILSPSSYGYGLRVYYANYYNTNNNTLAGIVANNFISISSGTGTNFGLYAYRSNKVNYYYNSVNISGGNTSSRALYYYYSTDVNLANNIFSNTAGGYAAYFSNPAGISTLDYNNYYTTGPTLAYWSGNRSNLTALQTVSGKDANSLSVDPTFNSATDLHTSNPFLNNAGTPIAVITDDIDGETRSTTSPDIGADEFDIINNTLITVLTKNITVNLDASGNTSILPADVDNGTNG